VNRLVLSATLQEMAALRYTPAGIPALDLLLMHESTQLEMGSERITTLALKALAFGSLAERLAVQALGGQWRFLGFLSNTRNGKGVVFHVQDFKPI
jgi:primosomal replication protein N